jgi:lipoyl(octanoyl) transferase
MKLWLGQRNYQDVTFKYLPGAPIGSVIGFETPLTITLGMRSLSQDSEILTHDHGAEIVVVDRGGHATLHNKGQLVIYPKVSLVDSGMGVRQFVSLLEQVAFLTLLDFGVRVGKKSDEPGLYSELGKMVFIGLRIKAGVVHHGLSINVCNELQDFTKIRSCGRTNEPTSSLKSHGVTTDIHKVFNSFYDHFHKAFFLTEISEASIF